MGTDLHQCISASSSDWLLLCNTTCSISSREKKTTPLPHSPMPDSWVVLNFLFNSNEKKGEKKHTHKFIKHINSIPEEQICILEVNVSSHCLNLTVKCTIQNSSLILIFSLHSLSGFVLLEIDLNSHLHSHLTILLIQNEKPVTTGILNRALSEQTKIQYFLLHHQWYSLPSFLNLKEPEMWSMFSILPISNSLRPWRKLTKPNFQRSLIWDYISVAQVYEFQKQKKKKLRLTH